MIPIGLATREHFLLSILVSLLAQLLLPLKIVSDFT
jgi:hypothetical protein